MALLLEQIEWSEPLLPLHRDAALEAEARRTFGAVPEVLSRVMRSPWIARFYMDLFSTRFVAAPEEQLDLAAFVTAQENACRYCYGATRAALKILGYSEERVSALERTAELAHLDDGQRAMIRFCRKLARCNPRPGASELATLGASERAGKELVFYIATQCFSNRVATMLAIPPEARLEQLSGSVLGRLMRPLIRRLLRKKPRSRLGNEVAAGGPYGGVVRALAGLPCAATLEAALDGAFAPGALTVRSPALMFAVVAHSLGCVSSMDEALRLLSKQGLTDGDARDAVANLGSPRLDTVENALLPFARETVRYQTGAIQKCTRALRDQLGPDAALEAIGMTALANAVVRLGMLVG